ncbi:MAG: ABC transporter permease [Rhizobiales bacterium]|nr:ABC transporter permease [Hyphomicrobiales bacterium]
METAWRDVVDGLGYRDYWWTMAWNDIRSRYRRSKIGQFWITLSVGLFVLGIGVVYAGIFGQSISDYMPRLTVSYVMWMFISSMLIGGCMTFISASATMQQRLFPISVHAYRLVTRELIILAHNAIVVVIVWIVFQVGVTPAALLVIPAIAINAYIGFWIAMTLGIASVRYRDVPPIATSLVSILFFITPVMWATDRLGGKADLIVLFNPFAYLLAIVRDPMLGIVPSLATWGVSLGIAAAATLIGLYAMSLTRHRLAYWL